MASGLDLNGLPTKTNTPFLNARSVLALTVLNIFSLCRREGIDEGRTAGIESLGGIATGTADAETIECSLQSVETISIYNKS